MDNTPSASYASEQEVEPSATVIPTLVTDAVLPPDPRLSPYRSYMNMMGNITAVYFLGIGGIGMSALARFFHSKGYNTAGYDRTSSKLTDELAKEGITVVFDESVDAIPDAFRDKAHTLVVRTPAVPETMEQYVYFLDNGFLIVKRAQALGYITENMRSLCVAGTHGKTTTSAMLAHLIYQSDINCNAFLGGISNNYGTNLLLQPDSNYVVVEADEYDRSFLHLNPYITVVTSVDPDHLDIYGDAEHYIEGFRLYCRKIVKGGALVIKHGLTLNPELQQGVRTYTYGVVSHDNDNETLPHFYADNIQIRNGQIYFDFHTPSDVLTDLKLGVPVWINIENAVAAMAVAWLVGVELSQLRLGIASFAGTQRRFNIHISTPDLTYIDDYAHHPSELRESILSIRRLLPGKKLTGVFQPHLYTRTRDFADQFAQVLSTLDEVILLPIYPAREEPIEGVDSQMILDKITCPNKSLVSKEQLIEKLKSEPREVIVTLGAGDIDRLVQPIKEAFSQT